MYLRFALILLVFLFESSFLQAGPNAYVTNYESNTVSVIDTATDQVVATVPVGVNPIDIAITPDKTRVYVANNRSGSVSVINTITNTIITTITEKLRRGLFRILINSSGTEVYVLHFDGTLSIINTNSNTVIKTIQVGNPTSSMSFSRNGSFLYVTNRNASGKLTVIDTTSNNIIKTIIVGSFPQSILCSVTADIAYIINEGSNSITVINTLNNTVINTISNVGNEPRFGTITPDGSKLYIASGNTGIIWVIDTLQNTIITTINPNTRNSFITAHPNGKDVYLVSPSDNSIYVISTTSNTVTKRITNEGETFFLARPLFLVFNEGIKGYVTNSIRNTVAVINTTSKKAVYAIGVGASPGVIVIATIAFSSSTPTTEPPFFPDVLVRIKQKRSYCNPCKICNIVKWETPIPFVPIRYLIYRDASLQKLAGTVSGDEDLIFIDHKCKKNRSYSYYIVAELENEEQFLIGFVKKG